MLHEYAVGMSFGWKPLTVDFCPGGMSGLTDGPPPIESILKLCGIGAGFLTTSSWVASMPMTRGSKTQQGWSTSTLVGRFFSFGWTGGSNLALVASAGSASQTSTQRTPLDLGSTTTLLARIFPL